MHKTTLAIAAALALAGLAHAAATTLPAEDARARAVAAGYTPVGEVELDDGAWEIEARDRDGRLVEVHVDAASGEILSPLQPGQVALSADQVRARLAQLGYADVRELERDDGHWSAEVRLPDGSGRELRVHPLSGAIVADEAED